MRLDAAAEDPSMQPPPVAARLIHAFQQAVQRPRGRFVIRETPIGDGPIDVRGVSAEDPHRTTSLARM